jgi:hypothetical protein
VFSDGFLRLAGPACSRPVNAEVSQKKDVLGSVLGWNDLDRAYLALHLHRTRTGEMGVTQSNVRYKLPALGYVGPVHILRELNVTALPLPSSEPSAHITM